jgi:histidinol-phosphate aminotransferase
MSLVRAHKDKYLHERPSHVDLSLDEKNKLRLHKNENTDPIFNAFLASVISNINPLDFAVYPDIFHLYQKLAAYLMVKSDSLIITAGADGAIRLFYEFFQTEKPTVLLTRPTFAMYDVYAKIYHYQAVFVDYEKNHDGFAIDLEEAKAKLLKHRPGLFFLANPDSPTGSVIKNGDIKALLEVALETNTFVVIDEAYYWFYPETALGLVELYPNVAVIRTFSKAWGLAGARVGYVVSNADAIKGLHKIRPMYEIGNASVKIIEAVLDHEDEMLASVKRLEKGKAFFKAKMHALGFEATNCYGNFQHVNFSNEAGRVHKALASRVIYKQDFPGSVLEGYSRFSSAPENMFEEVVDIITNAIS